MKFNKLVAVLAVISLAVQANAQDGMLRRQVAQNDGINAESTSITTNVNVSAPATAASSAAQQPATVVEAQPVVESKAEQLRKARVGAEISTEQKIVEKLEESRLREEQERADRLFGTKLDAQQSKALEDAAANGGGKLAPAPVVAPVQAAPTQVTIEKVEIIQPAAPAPIAAPEIKSVEVVKEEPVVEKAVVAPAPVEAKSVVSAQAEEPAVKKNQLYVQGTLGVVNYDASNVKSNFGGGFAVGLITNERVAIEGSFLYSNHYIDTFWNPGIYRELDQYDVGVNAKYYLINERIKPYIGAGLSYITRNYSQRIVTSNGYQTTTVAGPSEDQTTAINGALLLGADFKVNDLIMVGAGFDYSTNLSNTNSFNFNNYGVLPENTKALEEINFWTLKATASMTF